MIKTTWKAFTEGVVMGAVAHMSAFLLKVPIDKVAHLLGHIVIALALSFLGVGKV